MEILLSSKFYSDNEELMIDELLGLFTAGFKTTHTGTVNMLANLSQPKNKSRKERVFAEVDKHLDPIKEDLIGNFD
jgi:cytochrome P450